MEFDILLRGGTVVDGTGAPARPADVGIAGERIAAVGDLRGSSAATEIDASGRTVAPSMCPGCLETRIYSSRGIPSVAFGPGPPAEMHAPTEHVPIDNLLEAAAVYAITLGEHLGTV